MFTRITEGLNGICVITNEDVGLLNNDVHAAYATTTEAYGEKMTERL